MTFSPHWSGPMSSGLDLIVVGPYVIWFGSSRMYEPHVLRFGSCTRTLCPLVWSVVVIRTRNAYCVTCASFSWFGRSSKNPENVFCDACILSEGIS